MPRRRVILLTNDDGIEAPGLQALWSAVRDLGEVHVVAPESERSAASHSVTIDSHMAYRLVDLPSGLSGHALDGTPADCVKLAVTRLLEARPDVVLSGINPGANIGNNILYSGTVAAAREAVMLGVPALAVSVGHVHRGEGWHYEGAAQLAAGLVESILERGLPPGVLLNLNAPNIPVDEIRGLAVSRQGRSMFIDDMAPHGEGPHVRAFRNVGKTLVSGDDNGEDTDHRVLEGDMASLTPLHFDLTRHDFRAELSRWVEDMDRAR